MSANNGVSVRTATHVYPQEEIDAMLNFYENKKCVVSWVTGSTEWCHILDAALQTSNERVS